MLLSKYGKGKPETSINVRFRAWNARLCMLQVFPYHILIEKLTYKVFDIKSNFGGGRPEVCINVHLRAWNAHLCMSQFFAKHISFKKIIYKYLVSLNQNMLVEDLSVRLRNWNSRFCMSQVFPHKILIKKKYFIIWFSNSKYGNGSFETCINVRFRSWNAFLYISQVFHHHILIKKKEQKLGEKVFFLIKIWWRRSETRINVRFRIWNAPLSMCQIFPYHILIKKPNTLKIGCFYQNMGREDLRHALTCVSGPETQFYTFLRSSITIFWLKKEQKLDEIFLKIKYVGEDLRHA